MTTRNRVPPFAFLCAVSILFWWHSLVMTLGLALANDAYTHILLILPLSVALIYLDSKHLDSKHQDSKYGDSKALRIDPQPSPRIGAALLVLALLIGGYARWGMTATVDDVRLSLGMFALVTWWIASVLFCFGARTFQSFLFPLCFLFLMVPIPEFCFELDRRILATAVCGSGANLVSGGWGSGGAGWNHAVYSWTGHRSCTRVQQYSLQSNAGRHHHGFGSSFSALMVAESSARSGGDSAVCRKKRTSHLHDCRAWNSSGPWVSQREAPSQWRDRFLWYWGSCGGSAAMDPAAN